MPRPPIQEPEVKRAPNKHDDLEVTHPAFAGISAHRVSGSAYLFDSDFAHNHYMVVRIYDATLYRSHSNDRIHEGRAYIEVAMSMAQWVRFITNTNADVTPCTLTDRLDNGKWVQVPELPPPAPVTESFKDDVQRDAQEALNALRELDVRIDQMEGLSNKKRIELRSLVLKARGKLTDSIPFVADQFTEKMEGEVEKAKTEVHTYIQTAIHHAGLAALGAKPPISLPGREGIYQIPLEVEVEPEDEDPCPHNSVRGKCEACRS